MPDLLTHYSVAYLVSKVKREEDTSFFSPGYFFIFFMIGTVLPDLLTRSVEILFPLFNWFVTPLHTPLCFMLVCYVFCMIFEEGLRKSIFCYLILGGFLHIFLDLLQKHVYKGAYSWLFPFTWERFNIPLLWPSDTIYIAPFLVLIVLIFEIAHYLKSSRHEYY